MRRSIAAVRAEGKGISRLVTPSRLVMLRSSSIGALRLGGAGANYLLQGWIARICGPHEFGIYALCWSIVMFAAAVSNAGLQLLVIQTIPEYLERHQPDLAKGFILSAHGLIIVAAIVVMATILLAGQIVPPFLDGVPTTVLILYLCAIPTLAFFTFWMELAVPMDAAILGYCAYSVAFTFSFAALVTGIAVFAHEANAWSIGIALNLALLSSWLFLAVSLCRCPPMRQIRRQTAAFAVRRWSSAIPSLFTISVLEVAQRHFHILLASIWLSPGQIGVLYAATRSAFVLELLCSGYSALFTPILGSRFHACDMDGVRTQFRKSARALLLVCMASVVVCVVGGRQLLLLFGSEFTEGYATLVILAVAFATRFAFGPCLQLLLIASMRRTILHATAAAFLINVVISLVLVPRYGFDAVAIGPGLGMTAGTVIFLVALWRRFGVFGMFGRSA
jgi:O-antigen/teichoic acid export membrane protein